MELEAADEATVEAIFLGNNVSLKTPVPWLGMVLNLLLCRKKNPDQTVAEKLRVRVTTGIILQGGLIDILSQFVVEKLKFGH